LIINELLVQEMSQKRDSYKKILESAHYLFVKNAKKLPVNFWTKGVSFVHKTIPSQHARSPLICLLKCK